MNYKIKASYLPTGKYHVTIVGTREKTNNGRIFGAFEKCRRKLLNKISHLNCDEANRNEMRRYVNEISKKQIKKAYRATKLEISKEKSAPTEMVVAGYI
jgi:hypothetical protein